jgi:hypothetical protein
MRPKQFLISVSPAAWEWLVPAALLLLGALGQIAVVVGHPLVLAHAFLSLALALPLFWLSTAHATDAHLRRRINAVRDLSGGFTMLALGITLLSGSGLVLLAPRPLWLMPFHRWGAVFALLALSWHLALTPHGRKINRRGYLMPSLPEPESLPIQASLQEYAAQGLPEVKPDMPLITVLAIFMDYLRENKLILAGGFSQRKDLITCQFTTCPLAGKCPLPHSQTLACRLLSNLARATLARGGYAVEVSPAKPTGRNVNVAFKLRLLPE